MKVLTQPGEIRKAVHALFRDPRDERIAAVAYVGKGALSFLPNPRGIRLYCWPQVGGTNPIAIQDLLKAKVDIKFVDRLHAKVFWSRKHGVLIGSANLTNNALGDQPLYEATVQLPRGAFNMQAFVKTLRVLSDRDGTLKELFEAHNLFMERNPRQAKRAVIANTPLASFDQWMTARHEEWRLGWYEDYATTAPADAAAEFESETGGSKHQEFIGAKRKDEYKPGVFTLSFRVKAPNKDSDVTVSNMQWWAPMYVAKTRNKGWKEYPYIWFAKRRIPLGTRPPFDASSRRFKLALQAAINSTGCLRWLYAQPTKPSNRFLNLVLKHYRNP